MLPRILSVVGTRPEAIKMAPLIEALGARPDVVSMVCVTGQHREMLDQVLTLFGIAPRYDLDVMRNNRNLNDIVRAVISGVDQIIDEFRPDRVLVHGDTSTAMAAALAAFNRGVPVGHVEAGMRTYDMARPWPEELNRRIIDIASDVLFAPTAGARRNLLAETVTGRILVTGNTVIDALQATVRRLEADPALSAELDAGLSGVGGTKRLILVTGHRRESLGDGLVSVCGALVRLAERGDVEVVYALHRNPKVEGPVRRMLADRPHIHLIPPQSYVSFIRLMQRAHLVITDSGGVQEEAPALGTPVLVTRTETERPEADGVGTSRLVGTGADEIVTAAARLLDDELAYRAAAQVRSPFGDGRAASRIVQALMGEPVEEFDVGRSDAQDSGSFAQPARVRRRRAARVRQG